MIATKRRIALLPMLAGGVILIGGVPATNGGCIERDVVSSKPSTSTIFTSTVQSEAVDKVDLLFVIDNSASMGDKQAYLEQSVPDLLNRLVNPNCIDPSTSAVVGSSDSNGKCANGVVEFPAVHDMHIGVISTSLGSRLSGTYGTMPAICDPTSTVTLPGGVTLSNHNDDRGELLNRAGENQETPLASAGTSNYLNWFPNVPANAGRQPSPGAPPIADAKQLSNDFTALVAGVDAYGCGIESQLESWYRFLVQPDPYDSLVLSNGKATWSGVDTTILKQRHDFLRPDSLVAIIDLTDENDSEIDVRALQGQGYLFMDQGSLGGASGFDPRRGTSDCAENARGSGLVNPLTCTSCAYSANASTDPSCQMGPYTSPNDWGENMNLRHVHMMQKYGVWPQFPIERYVLGLTSPKIPDRTGEYPSPDGPYQGLTDLNCTNPLFAATLPDGSSTDPATLCHLPLGPRGQAVQNGASSYVYFAHIGGVPHQLLQQPNGQPKDTLGTDDWKKILGNDPEHEDYTGADPHMIESFQPRAGVEAPSSPPAGGNPDPVNGRDWVTDQGTSHILPVDREYACMFQLDSARDCTNTADPSVVNSCDCPSTPTLTYEQLPPICDPVTQTQQTGAKAYPTVRELLLAKLLGTQGIVSSICPIHVKKANDADPLYGYRPAMKAIVDRLGQQLTAQKAPEKLSFDPCGQVQCLLMATLPEGTTEANCAQPGMSTPAPDVLSAFQNALHQQWVALGSQGPDLSTRPSCQMNQLWQLAAGESASVCGTPSPASDFDTQGSCRYSKDPGWCYVASQQLIVFSNDQPPPGVAVTLECLEQGVTVVGGGAVDGG
jgi:hypothetical protein